MTLSTCQYRALVACALLALLAPLGCSRNFYRQQADQQAHCLLDQKALPAESTPGRFRIDVDPRSRMFDPFDPDCEPMPPDDPTAAQYLECVDGKRGSSDWQDVRRTSFVDSPSWQSHLPRDEKGQLTLDQQSAVELALVHSTGYQSQIEELYLSALDVSFERFRFDTQFFGGSEVAYTADGYVRAGGNASSVLEVSPASPSNRWRAATLTATGGSLVVGLANSLVWQFAGPDDYNGNTLLDFSLVQPLLRAGGRTVVLETLTIAERALLYNVRQMERYRRGFYVNILTGRDAGSGPSRRGGFFGGSGLQGFTGVGGGGFGRVGGFGGGFGGGGGGGFTGGAGAAQAGGIIGLMQDQQELRNQRANVAALRTSVVQLQATYEAGRIDRFQVDLARQALFNAQSLLLQAENGYQASTEGFLLDIGLPPELPLVVRDPMLDQFNLLDPDLEEIKAETAELLDVLRTSRQQLVERAAAPDAANPAENLPPSELTVEQLPLSESDIEAQLAEAAAASERLAVAIAERLAALEEDFAKLDAALPQRRAALEQLASRDEVRQAEIDLELLSGEKLDLYVRGRKDERTRLSGVLDETRKDLYELGDTPTATQLERYDRFIAVLGRAAGELVELSLLQASVRLETVTIDPVELEVEQALAIASAYRRDWKNARANLVDSWRLIEFNANNLQSNLDLEFSGDIGNVGQNPFKLRGNNGRLRVGLAFDAPLTRLNERNVYRQSLIEYQQARRSYYRYRDQVYLSLRNTLRQVRLNEINLELRRAAVQLAISQVDLTQLRLSEPPKPGETAEFSNTTARDLVQSLSDLLNVQNDFLSVWVNHVVQQMNLEFDLGLMELDDRGMRIETNQQFEAYLSNLPEYPSDLYPGQGIGPRQAIYTEPLLGELDERSELVEPRLLPGTDIADPLGAPAGTVPPELPSPGQAVPKLAAPELAAPELAAPETVTPPAVAP